MSDLRAAVSSDRCHGLCCVLGQGSFHAPESARKVEGVSLPRHAQARPEWWTGLCWTLVPTPWMQILPLHLLLLASS